MRQNIILIYSNLKGKNKYKIKKVKKKGRKNQNEKIFTLHTVNYIYSCRESHNISADKYINDGFYE